MLSMIVATDLDGAIGNEGDLLYYIPEDLKRFKELTFGNVVVMGRKTFEGLPNQQPLKDRTNIVITRNPTKFVEKHEGKDIHVMYIQSFINLIESYPNEEVFVIGGAEIYKQLMPYIDKIYLTRIYDDKKEADTFIDISFDEFKMTYKSELKRSSGLGYKFINYVRK